MEFGVDGIHFDIGHQVDVAPDAILLNNFFAGIFYLNDLRFGAEGEYGGVPQAILPFEIIRIEQIVLRDVAIVAGCPFPMGAVHPSGILGSHDVTVDTCFGLVGKVRGCIGYVNQE